MDYTTLRNVTGKTSKVGIIGATRGYGYTLLAQIPSVKNMELRVICSRHTDECMDVLREIGYPEEKIRICSRMDEVENAPEDAILIVDDYRLVSECGITAMVECTGNTKVSSEAALAALHKGINVYMVSKETDSVCGPLLNQVAAENGVVYALVNGDSPEIFWTCIPGPCFWDWKWWLPESPANMILYGTGKRGLLHIWMKTDTANRFRN